MKDAYINHIVTAVPPHDIHNRFLHYAPRLLETQRDRVMFSRIASRCEIDSRFSFLEPADGEEELDKAGFYKTGKFPDTASRMMLYERHALPLSKAALDKLIPYMEGITHLIVTSCTGFYAPGIDLEIMDYYRLPQSVERMMIGFMGCHAGITALKMARHIIRSDQYSRILIVNIELCTLHLQDSAALETAIPFLLFADGCAASIVSADPAGLKMERFTSVKAPETSAHITWRIGASGFLMNLSAEVPAVITAALPEHLDFILGGRLASSITHWAIHPGGRAILDAVRNGAAIEERKLTASRSILRRFGNMSSPTIMFVLKEIMEDLEMGTGCAMAFGPGLSIESMMFEKGSHA